MPVDYEDQSDDRELTETEKSDAQADIAASNELLMALAARYKEVPQRGMFVAAQVLCTMSAMAGVSRDTLLEGVASLYTATVETLVDKDVKLPAVVTAVLEEDAEDEEEVLRD